LTLNLFGILILGLNPKDFYFSNNVKRTSQPQGIKFGKIGIAFTEAFLEPFSKNISELSEFSFEISLKPQGHHEGIFSFIIALHDGEDSEQLLMGQWRTHIILMNADHYNYKRQMKRISFETATLPSEEFFITVTTGKGGTKLYIDGQLLLQKNDLTLKIPNGGTRTRLIIGNSAYGRNFWKGKVYGLAFYQYKLTSHQVKIHHDQWSKYKNFSFAKKENPYLLYLFNETNISTVVDRSGHNNHLNIPSRMRILKKRFLRQPTGILNFNSVPIKDIILNLIGFIPFGIILTASLIRMDGFIGKHGQLMTVVFGLLLSLTIEIIQSWMPTRYSSILDLVLNTSGTLAGATIYKTVLHMANFRN
jgi:hypothetical protein